MKVLALSSVLGLAMLAVSCGDSAPEKKSGSFKIAVIPKGTAHEFWKAVEAGARKADEEFADLTIVWKGPSGEGDAEAQIAVVESFLADKVDGICLAPLEIGRASCRERV